jgi:hypothetical protein
MLLLQPSCLAPFPSDFAPTFAWNGYCSVSCMDVLPLGQPPCRVTPNAAHSRRTDRAQG